MSQAILISEDEVINSLYELNLRAYVATNVTVKTSLEGAMKLLEQSPNIDAIICFRDLDDKENSIDSMHAFLKEHNLKVPIIVLGEPGTPLKETIVIHNKYDIKSLLQAMARILQITAKDMAVMQVPKYFPIPIKLFGRIDQSHCDIYFRRQLDSFEYEYYKIIEKETPIGDKLGKYLAAGVEHLYIDASQRLKFINRASTVVIDELSRDDLSSAERMEITSQGMGIVAEQVFQDEKISDEIAQISVACSDSIVRIAKAVPKLKNLLGMLLENKADYVYKHSVLATYFASSIIKNISWGSKEQSEKVAFVLFFHDIFLVPIYRKYKKNICEEDLLFAPGVTEEDKKVLLEHAMMAATMIKNFPRCPMGADMIILQHHGMTNGVGFAVNFKDDISPLAKIIAISEDIAGNLLTEIENKPGQKVTLNKEEAAKRLKHRFKGHSYKKIIEAFEECEF